MRKISIAAVLALVAGIVFPALGWAPADASPGDEYAGAYFGENNFPPDCTRDRSATNPDNICYRMKAGLNGLDSPKIDVLVMVPVSPTAERDMRIMRQSVEMWEGGIGHLADQMGLDWLAQGVDFHITVDYVDLEGGQGSEFSTYPITDPEIVVIASNPVGGVGIGIDPIDFADEVGFTDEDDAPCHGIANPFDFDAWENVPGFDSHHGNRSGTYVEDCQGAGGNICFAVNGAVDPEPTTIDVFNLFDLVSHEVGHCLTLGHVGDGGEATIGQGWGVVPTNDIMSYNPDPPGLNKCVSTLDVETFALRMSRYLDVNGDGAVTGEDVLSANDTIGDGLFAFQVQHPGDHLYASSTGAPSACPQPDLGLVPGKRTDWTPEPAATSEPVLTVTSPADGSTSAPDGAMTVSGSVERRSVTAGSESPGSGTDSTTAEASPPAAGEPATALLSTTLTFEGRGGNTFLFDSSTLGVTSAVNDTRHHFDLDLVNADVDFTLTWTNETGQTNLDLYVTGATDSGTTGATTNNMPETVSLKNMTGHLDITVDPYLVTEPLGSTYTLEAVVTPLDGGNGGLPEPDADRDAVPDAVDRCPIHPGASADGCTPLRATQVVVSSNGTTLGAADVHADYGPDTFEIPVSVPPGTNTLRIAWLDGDRELAAHTVTVTGPPDNDGDSIADAQDNCPHLANADQSNIDGDPHGDACDADMDGEGYTNRTEARKESDPHDPASVPKKRR